MNLEDVLQLQFQLLLILQNWVAFDLLVAIQKNDNFKWL